MVKISILEGERAALRINETDPRKRKVMRDKKFTMRAVIEQVFSSPTTNTNYGFSNSGTDLLINSLLKAKGGSPRIQE